MSYHSLSTKPLNKSLKTLLKRTSHVGLGLGAFTPVLALANPTGGQVVAGQASITAPAANGLVIHQASQSAIINWQQFNIGANEYVQFLQPSSSSVVLNRVVGGNPTSIFGNLSANGQVFLVNTNGVFFGHGASVDAQGFLASSLDINNSNFLNGNYLFNKAGNGGASVVNQGKITAHHGGYVVLAGDYSENDGVISAQSGHVVLAAGSKSTLTLQGNSLVSYVVNGATLASLAGADNSGQLLADGGTVIMTADVANALKATVVNNTGLVEARSISSKNGDIFLSATGGNIVNAGTLDADAMVGGQAGGNIVLKGDGVTNLTNTSRIMATGMGAEGGHLELSGRTLNVRGTANLGRGGNMLLDPGTMSISTGTKNSPGESGNTTSVGHIGVGFIDSHLNNGVTIDISASKLIEASANVKTAGITATGTGALGLTVGPTGRINLTGVNIAIGGAFNATMSKGTFDHITAKTINMHATAAVTLADASTSAHGKINYSAKATGGNLSISAAKIVDSAEGLFALDAVGGGLNLNADIGTSQSNRVQGNVVLQGKTIDDQKNVYAAGAVTAAASGGYATLQNVFGNAGITVTTAHGPNADLNIKEANAYGGGVTLSASGGTLHAGSVHATTGNVSITDKTGKMTLGDVTAQAGNVTVQARGQTLSFSGEAGLFASGNIIAVATTLTHNAALNQTEFSAGGNVTINGKISIGDSHDNLRINAGGNIAVDHDINVDGSIDITGAALAYGGGGKNFSISAGYGDFTLNAAIGSAHAPVKYNVNLEDFGYGLFIDKSIFAGHTAGGLAANITATETGKVGAGHTGVLVSAGSSSHAAQVTLSAAGNVSLTGYDVGVGAIVHVNGGPVTITAGGNVLLAGTGAGSGGQVGVKAGAADADANDANTSISITAAGNLTMTGNSIEVHAGKAFATAEGGSASADADVTLRGGNKVTLTAVNQVSVDGNSATAIASADVAPAKHPATANAAVNVIGGKGIAFTGHTVQVSGGYGVAKASAQEGGVATATANTNVLLRANTGSIRLTGGSAENGSVTVHGGFDAGHSGHALANNSYGGVVSKATANVNAGVTLSAAAGAISLTAENIHIDAGYGAGLEHNASSHTGTFDQLVKAEGDGAQATYTATADVNLLAGAGGIQITGSNASIHGGGGQLNGADILGNSTGIATVTTSARVNLSAVGGNITVTGHHDTSISAGELVAAAMRAEGNEGGTATVSADGGVSLTGTNITIGSGGAGSGHIRINNNGAFDAASHAVVTGSSGSASVSAKSRVDLTATTGNISLSASRNINAHAGSAEAGASVTGNDGHATLNVNLGVGFKAAHGSITLTGGAGSGSSRSINLNAGKAGERTHVNGYGSGVAQFNALSSLSVVAGKNFKAIAKNVNITAGGGVAQDEVLDAGSSAKALVNANGAFNVTAANVVLQASQDVSLQAGGGDAENIGITANGAGSASVAANNSINITTPGILRIVGGNNVTVGGAFIEGVSDNLSAVDAAKATVNANGGVTLIGGTVTLNAVGGKLSIEGGIGAGGDAQVSASDNGQAVVNANAGVTLSATAGNLVLAGKTGINVAGGRFAAAGSSSGTHTSFTSVTAGTSAGTGTETVHHVGDVSYTRAVADGSHAIATINGNNGLTLTATGNVTLNQTSTSGGTLDVHGGDNAAAFTLTSANAGGVATITGTAGVRIKAGAGHTVALGGHYVHVRGGRNAVGNGAQSSSYQAHFSGSSLGNTSQTGTSHENKQTGQPDHANGAASKAIVTGDGSVTIQGTTVSLTAHGDNVSVSGGYAAGSHAAVSASNGGLASVSGKAGVTIAAQTFTAKAPGTNAGIFLGGGFEDGGGASVVAKNGGQALLNVNSGLTLTAASVSLVAGRSVEVFAGGKGSDAYGHGGANVMASDGGSAAFNANAAANITVSKSFTASLSANSSNHGFMGVFGGTDAGVNAQVHSVHATAALNVNDNVSITAGGSIVLSTLKNKGAIIGVSAGSYGGYGASVTASGSSFNHAKATATIGASVSLSAKANVAINAAAGSVNFEAFSGGGPNRGGHEGGSAFVGARHGTANLTTNNTISVSGANVKVHAGSYTTIGGSPSHHVFHNAGNINVKTAQFGNDANSAHVKASTSGSASLDVNHGLQFSTPGTLSLTAAATLEVGYGCCSHNLARGAQASAHGSGAKAAINLDESTLFKGNAAVILTGGSNVALTTVSGARSHSGSPVSASAGSHGNASFRDNSELNIVTKGAFTLKAGEDAFIGAGNGGVAEAANAGGPGAQASYLDDGNINISAKTVAISAASNIDIGGNSVAGWEGRASASYGGIATYTSTRNVNITAVSALSLALTGKVGGNHGISIGGDGAGLSGHAVVTSGGKASFAAHQDVNLTVTAAGGTINMNAGNQHRGIDIHGDSGAGSQGYAGVTGAGTASYTATGNVNITAPGAVIIVAPHGDVTLGGASNIGESMGATAIHGGQAKATASGNLSVRGTGVKVSAGTFTSTTGTSAHPVPHHNAGNVTLAAGGLSNGKSADVNANGAVATATINDQLSVVATAGALTVNAAQKLEVSAGYGDNGESAGAHASFGGAANLTLNQTALLSGRTAVNLTASNVRLAVDHAEEDNGDSAGVTASHAGKAAITQNQNVNIVATNGDVNVTASGNMAVLGASSLGSNVTVKAHNLNAQATYTANGSINITGSHVRLAAGTKRGGDLTIEGGFGESGGSGVNVTGSYGGAAAYNVVTDVNITGRKAVNITLGSGEGITIEGGNYGGKHAHVSANAGKASLTVSQGVNISATSPGAAIVVATGKHSGSNIFIGGGKGLGWEASADASNGGSANLTATGNVSLHAAGALTISAHNDVNIRGTGSEFAGGVGSSSSSHVQVSANKGGRAGMTLQAQTNLTGSAVALTATTGSLDINGGGGSNQLSHTKVVAGSSASAALNAVSAVNIVATKGAVNATAGGGVFITGAAPIMGFFAKVNATGSDANAVLNASETVNISGGNITVTGNSVLMQTAAVQGEDMSVAVGSSHHSVSAANATANLNGGITLNATGNVTLTGLHSHSFGPPVGSFGVAILAGFDAGHDQVVTANGSQDKAISNVNDGVTINAGGTFKALAPASVVEIIAGNDAGAGATVFSSDGGSATQTVNADVDIKAGGAMTLSGKNDVGVFGGFGLGGSDHVTGDQSNNNRGVATQALSANVNLTAGGSMNFAASYGGVFIKGGSSAGHRNQQIFAGPGVPSGHGATAVYTANAAVNVQAGGNLNITAAKNVDIQGGGSIALLPVASYGGVAAVNINTGVTVKTGGNLSLTAGTGSIAVRAGGGVSYLGDFSHVGTGGGSHGTAGRAVKANLNTAVDVEAAGSATAVAGGNLIVSAGDGALLAIGEFRLKSFAATGTKWQGGSASVNGNFGATFKAGKNLTLTAGKSGVGSLAIDALQGFGSAAPFGDVLQVRGGSSSAHAKLNMNANALVQAGGNITVSVADNMGVYAGSLADVRADHVLGSSYVVTANANATLKAGGNITLAKIGGGLTVAGAGVNSSHSGILLAEAAGLNPSGAGKIVVSENANALISAGGNITTTTAIGGDLSILGASRVDGIVLGHTEDQTATVSGNVTLNAVGNVTLNATGNIHIAGPGSAGVSVESFGNDAQITDKVQAKDTVSAGGTLSLTAGGNLEVGAGNGLKAIVNPNASNGSALALASGDVSTTLRAGGAMTLHAGGNLLIHAGSGAEAEVRAFGGFNSYTAVANANANIIAGGNLTIVAGSGATFQGGSQGAGQAFGIGFANTATATAHADLNLTVGGNLAVTATGPVNIFGGPLVEGGGSTFAVLALGINNQATATVTGKVNVMAGGNVAITATGGNLTVTGGSSAASFREVGAGTLSGSSNAFNNKATANVDASVNIKGHNVSLAATGGVFISAGRQVAPRELLAAGGSVSSSGSPAHGSDNKASLTVNSSVNVTATGTITVSGGTAVNLAAAHSNSQTVFVVGSFGSSAHMTQVSGVKLKAPTVTITPNPSISGYGSFSSSGNQYSGGVFSTVHSGGPAPHLTRGGITGQSLHLAPSAGVSSFGGLRAMSRGLDVLNSGRNSTLHTAPTAFVAPVTRVDLGALQDLGLVTHLVPLFGDASIALVPMADSFLVPVERRQSLLAPQVTKFTPEGSGSSQGPAGER